ncbi:MAG TPA: replication factor A [Methanosarcinales archaeon]|nr:replication factor A [Methanosarcinales archaeon]
MGETTDIAVIYERLGGRVTLDDFMAKIEEKVATMGGLCDEETAALLVAQELGVDSPAIRIRDITSGDNVSFGCKVISVSGVREFSRDDGSIGRVANITVGDETGTLRVSLWDELVDVVKRGGIEAGQHLQISGYARDGYGGGVEVSVGRTGHIEVVEPMHEINVDERWDSIADLQRPEYNAIDVNVVGQVLHIGDLRTFVRKGKLDSTGRVGSITIGDETGKIRVVLWDDRADLMEDLNAGDCIEITGGYTRENNYDGATEIHIGDHGRIEKTEKRVDYVENVTQLSDIGIDETCTVVGYVTGLEETKEITRSDGNVSKVLNIHISDETGSNRVRVALWGNHADMPIDIGDKIQIIDCYVKSGWSGGVELSVGWKSSIRVIGD